MKQKNNLWVFVVVSLVVGVIASLATANITGNLVRVQTSPTGPSVYTPTEVDAKLTALKGSCEYVVYGSILVDKHTKQNFDTSKTLIKDTCKKAFDYAPKATVKRIEKQFCLGEGCQQLTSDGLGSVEVVTGGITINEYLWEAYSGEPLSKGGGGKGSKIAGTNIPYSYSENEMGVQGILCCK